jgi:2-oxoisovalerate dehydrogenase E1 component alpha subunit
VVRQDDERMRFARIDARRITLDLQPDDLLSLYRQMVRARLVDDMLGELRAQGIASGGASCRGHEAAQVGCMAPLHVGLDYILPYYRDLAAMLAAGMPAEAIFLNQLGRGTDPISGGRMRPAQWNSRALRVVSASGLVATQTLHAAGIAFAAKLRGEGAVALTFFGEGATSEGDFHEALNFASIHHLPVIFVCENNGVALSTPVAAQMNVAHVADRASGYGMPGVIVDGSDVLAVLATARDAFARARAGQGPTLIEIIIPRLAPQAALPDPRDPVENLRVYLFSRGDLAPAADEQMRHDIAASLAEAMRAALAAPAPDPDQVAEDLFAPEAPGTTPHTRERQGD